LLTALSDESSHIKGLDSGADDYITKPISTKVLMSRVNALFRRIQKETNHVLTVGDITIDSSKYSVHVNGHPISLAKKEFELLHLLATMPGRVFLRNEILEQVWGNDGNCRRPYHRCAHTKDQAETGHQLYNYGKRCVGINLISKALSRLPQQIS
jgi:DNA-binding response OmpR family regulator